MKSLELVEQADDRIGITEMWGKIGDTYAERGNQQKAEEYYQRSLDLAREIKDKRQVAECLKDLGKLEETVGWDGRARLKYRESLDIFASIGERKSEASLLVSLGGLEVAAGAVDSGIVLYSRALEIQEEIGNRNGAAATRCALAEASLKKSDSKAARLHAESALQSARKLGTLDVQKNAAELLVESNKALGDYKSALQYRDMAAEIGDSLQRSGNRKQVNELMAKYEAVERQGKIDLLERDRRLNRLELARRSEEIRRHHVESLQQSQEIELLAREKEVGLLGMQKTEAELDRNRQALELAEKDRNLQSSIIGRETLIRNAVIGFAVLFVALGVLIMRRFRDRKRTAELRAEAAEFQAQAAEAKTMQVQIDTERRERAYQKQFSKKLIQSQEGERKRLAAELHDGLGQELLVIKNRALLAMRKSDMDPETKSQFEDITSTAAGSLDNVRQMSRNLRPYHLDQFGLSETIETMLEQIRDSSEIGITWDIERIDGLFSKDGEINIYRIIQESMNNIVRHSGASQARVDISIRDREVELTVTDNGKGFDPENVRGGNGSGGFGLQGMTERVEILDGYLDLQTSEGNGTRIRITLPKAGSVAETFAEKSEVGKT